MKYKGLEEIDNAKWTLDETDTYNLHVHDAEGRPVHCWIAKRPPYCDRGHLMMQIDGALGLDAQDSFPRYFFSWIEADRHTRAFLRWRLYQFRHPDSYLMPLQDEVHDG